MMRIFALPLLVLSVIGGATIAVITSSPGNIVMLFIVFASLAAILCALWPTINFHRHVLLGERFGWLPRIHWREVFAYGIMIIALAIVVMVLRYLATLVIGLTMYAVITLVSPMATVLLFALLLGTIATAIGLRLFSLLPGLAISEPLTGYSPAARGNLTTILMIALLINLVLVSHFLLQVTVAGRIFSGLSTGASGAVIAMQLLLNAFFAIFGISLLTALYAQYVRRPA